MRCFLENYAGGFYTNNGYFGGMCCGAYQANTVEEFNEAQGGLVIFTDKEKYPNFSEDGEYLCHTIEHNGNHIHLKMLVAPKEDNYYNLKEYKEREVVQIEYPYTSIYLSTYLAYAQSELAPDQVVAEKEWDEIISYRGVVAYIYTPDMEKEWGVRSFLDDLEKNSELIYESPWFFNHNYLESGPRLKLMIYDRKS